MQAAGFPFPADVRSRSRLLWCPRAEGVPWLPSAFDATPMETCWLEHRQCLQAQPGSQSEDYAQLWAPAEVKLEKGAVTGGGGKCLLATSPEIQLLLEASRGSSSNEETLEKTQASNLSLRYLLSGWMPRAV